ncbi:MAG: hypothetical protein RLZZ453_1052 [Chlamydiota bacterium]|jgi:hypothetical protein
MAKTIDNLGPDASRKYAEGDKQYDPSFKKEAGKIPGQTEVSVLTPTPTQLELLFADHATVQPQAQFSPPPSYYQQRRNVFTYQLTPHIGPTTNWESNSQKIVEIVNSLPDDSPEKKSLTSFIEAVNRINRALISIKAEINRYHRG